jgi:hypothetical protein
MVQLMMMFRWRAQVFCAGQLTGQTGGLVDQHGQALRANEKFVALVFNGQQGFFLFGFATVQAGCHR